MKIAVSLLIFAAVPSGMADNPRADFARSVLLELRGEPAAAAAALEAARSADPLAAPLVERTARMRLAAGDRSGAATLLRELAAARPDEVAIQLNYVSFLQDSGRGDAMATKLAQEALTAALEKCTPQDEDALPDPAHPELIRRLFQIRLAAGDLNQARELLEELGPDPAATTTYASLWKNVHSAEDAAALQQLDQRLLAAHESNPRHAALARRASEHFRTSGRLDQAISVLDGHVAAAPASLALRTRLGILQLSAKRDADGERTLLEVLEIHPGQALAHQALAKHFRMVANAPAARIHAGELLKLRGGSPAEFLDLAEEWLAAMEPRPARLLLEKAAFDFPENAQIAAKLAIATRRDPDTQAHAARLFREAETIAADEEPAPEFLLESAEAMIEQGQIAAAEDRLRAAIRSFPPAAREETAAALRRLAGLWEAENRNPDAARALRQRADALAPFE